MADFHRDGKQLAKGDIVLINGLQNKIQLNNKFASVFSFGHGKNHDRYRIDTVNGNEQKRVLVKKENLQLGWSYSLTKLPKNSYGSEITFRCKACNGHIPYESKIMVSCSKCMSLYYCSIRCRDSHAEEHQLCCPAYAITLKESNKLAFQRLGSLQFDMKPIVHAQSPAVFGDWKHVQYEALSYSLLKYDMQQNPRIIKSWNEWYEFHRTPLSHPIAKDFHNVMTIYWALIQNGVEPNHKGEITVHLIGVGDSELTHDLHDFDELQLLLPYCNITFICFGPDAPSKIGPKVRRSNTFYFYKMLYEKETVAKVVKAHYKTADIVIGLNTGFATSDGPDSPTSGWPKALLYIVECRVPAFFTDYTMTCVLIQDSMVAISCGAQLSDIQPNPFVQPSMVFGTPGRVLSFYNNWMFTINTNGNRISKFRHNPLKYRLSEQSKEYRQMMDSFCKQHA